MIKVLIVDDEETVRNGLQKYIAWDRLQIDVVLTAQNAEEALEIVDTEHPDIIISDVRMPRLNGIELCTLIRDRREECRIIFLSGYADKEYLKSAILLSAEEYIEKPVDIGALEECLSRTVDKCRQDRESIRRQKELDWYRSSYIPSAGDAFTEEIPEELFEDISSVLMKNAQYHETVRRIIAYVNRHFTESDMSVRQIAEAVFISPTYLSAFFKSRTGSTIGQYIRDVRIRYAVYLLEEKRDNVLEVAGKCGYADANYFAKAFKKEKGVSPSEYREQIKDGRK